jgi:hypothetical protein
MLCEQFSKSCIKCLSNSCSYWIFEDGASVCVGSSRRPEGGRLLVFPPAAISLCPLPTSPSSSCSCVSDNLTTFGKKSYYIFVLCSKLTNYILFLVAVITLVWYTVMLIAVYKAIQWWKYGSLVKSPTIRTPVVCPPVVPAAVAAVNNVHIANMNVVNGNISVIFGDDPSHHHQPTPRRVRAGSLPRLNASVPLPQRQDDVHHHHQQQPIQPEVLHHQQQQQQPEVLHHQQQQQEEEVLHHHQQQQQPEVIHHHQQQQQQQLPVVEEVEEEEESRGGVFSSDDEGDESSYRPPPPARPRRHSTPVQREQYNLRARHPRQYR